MAKKRNGQMSCEQPDYKVSDSLTREIESGLRPPLGRHTSMICHKTAYHDPSKQESETEILCFVAKLFLASLTGDPGIILFFVKKNNIGLYQRLGNRF